MVLQQECDIELSIHRVEVGIRSQYADPRAEQLLQSIREYFGFSVSELRILRVYTIHKRLLPDQVAQIAHFLLHDPIIEYCAPDSLVNDSDWIVEVNFKEGVTDNTGKIAQLTCEDYLGAPFNDTESVRSSIQYLLKGKLSQEDVEKIAAGLFANTLIEEINIYRPENGKDDQRQNQYTRSFSRPIVEVIPLVDVDDGELLNISKQRQLVLNLSEMKAIQRYFMDEMNRHRRAEYGLTQNPTDVELEVFAQTWSEHCKHKIFNATIHYSEDGKVETIHGLFSTYIKRATEEIASRINWLVSVFTDNAGIIQFNKDYFLAFKVETHNSPSALDPYGGALTGILGVNRDIMGAGIGARLIANTNVLCFAPPSFEGEIPERLLHPRRIFEGVCKGIEHGGNKSGVPTVNGSFQFDERYLGKPLVYCGSVGIMPAVINGLPSDAKEIVPGDMIVIAGGRTGKDGIHGATFSSEALHANSPSTAVQIGDPFTQKKLHDFLLQARDLGLYRTLTDNGAGGFSSSIGELAILSGGCEVHLDRALLKQPGLAPWEIFLSESQERMTLAVPSVKWGDLVRLAQIHEVELVDLGIFTNTGDLHVYYNRETIALLSLDFLHHGLPKMTLDAEWKAKNNTPFYLPKMDYAVSLHTLLTRYTICSKESVVRQYDHEVQGSSVIKPFVGEHADGPGDAAVICPIETRSSREGIAIGHGICPRLSDIDAYHMAANAVDEAIRNCVCVGGDPFRMAILDNFCWPDPVFDPVQTPDGKHKLAQLVRANRAIYTYATGFGTPLISGKDSMKNDYKIGNVKISVPPTLLISAIAKLDDIETAITMDMKQPGDLIYVLGMTKNELGGSELAAMMGISGGIPPHVDVVKAKKLYELLHSAIKNGLVASCHDCSEGGFAVALAESAFAGGWGVDVSLKKMPFEDNLSAAELLFSESASRFIVTIHPSAMIAFERALTGCALACIGEVSQVDTFCVRGLSDEILIETSIHTLKKSWQKPFKRK